MSSRFPTGAASQTGTPVEPLDVFVVKIVLVMTKCQSLGQKTDYPGKTLWPPEITGGFKAAGGWLRCLFEQTTDADSGSRATGRSLRS